MELDLLEISKAFLEEAGQFKVDVSSSAIEALNVKDLASYDAIVSDYQMPMNGIEFLERLRNDRVNVPFILFTGKGREEVAITALNNGADFYLTKGGDPKAQFAELANMVGPAVARREAENALTWNLMHFRTLVENVSDLIAEVDGNGLLRYASPSVINFLGYSADEVTGTPLAKYLHPDDVDRALRGLTQAFIGQASPALGSPAESERRQLAHLRGGRDPPH